MGKPSLSSFPSDDGVSLHSQQPPTDRYLDTDAPELQVDDLPPLYDEAEGSSSSAPLLPPTAGGSQYSGSEIDLKPLLKNDSTGAEYYINSSLDNSPSRLQRQIEYWALTPPRPYVHIRGTHQATVDNRGKKERKAITDFDISIELTPYLYSDAINGVSWRELRTVDNSEKTRRGTVFRKRAPGATKHIEVGLAEKPTLSEWCHRYCASHAGLKRFTLERRIVGFDEARVREYLVTMIRATNYRGSLQIDFPVKNSLITVYNDCKTQRWRLTAWVVWIFYLTFLWIFTWPYLFFREKKFEVAVAEWPYSRADANGNLRYVSISEDHWYNMWGRAIQRAVLQRRQGPLTQQDLISLQGLEPTFDSAILNGAADLLRAGVSAMNEVNRQLGWGYDE